MSTTQTLSSMNGLEAGIKESQVNQHAAQCKAWFNKLIQPTEYVGDIYSINYEAARVMIHDRYRQQVGGIPSLSFLIATRVTGDRELDFKSEDCSLILFRVMDAAALPQDREAERIRVETAQRVSGETEKNWDNDGAMDPRTRNLLGYAGVECRIIGTFYLEDDPNNVEAPLRLKFGSDISNYYPNRGLKVYKPNAKALEAIVNHIDPKNLEEHIEKYGSSAKVKLGYVRYASTNRRYQQVNDVPVHIYPADLLSQKTALFGMTRTGKSNTTKIIAKSVFELRDPKEGGSEPLKIGQIIFDPNGEYANENAQDKSGNGNPSALKNVWKKTNGAAQDDVVTYGITPHKSDPNRKLMLLNFYDEGNLQAGKDIIDSILSEDSAKFIKNFVQVRFDKPDKEDHDDKTYPGAITRYNRRVLAYKTLLYKAGFAPPKGLMPLTSGLFGEKLVKKLKEDTSKNSGLYHSVAALLEQTEKSWAEVLKIFEGIGEYISDKKSSYEDFEKEYIKTSSTGEQWADDSLKKIITMFEYTNGSRQVGKAIVQHRSDKKEDYTESIYADLKAGRLVIIDQSSGEPEINKSSAERLMWTIFRKQQTDFRNGVIPSDILVYIEEAHNLLPAGSDLDLTDVWVRTAKEGAKYRIGMVYATQEVSSIQKNILKNTANWFISHLNNTDETKELCKYYDFADFEPSIRRAQDKGFLRVKTLSNLFVIPIQVDKFEVLS